ncbi:MULTISPECIES: hypothetical protein [unclassified Duganella]|uniref:hypothetical protein n=1 Tax=unclassified Duganella TaxID=2636909 RepID=UPI0013144529|nr:MULTISPECIES: hypothetical protein [unclassified Duganella]
MSLTDQAQQSSHAAAIGTPDNIHPIYKLRPLLLHLEAAAAAPNALRHGAP